MKKKLLSFFMSFLIYLSTVVLAQQPDLEKLLEPQVEYSDVSDLIEILDDLAQNPINLNQATAEQLAILPWISYNMALAIINYRNQIGKFNSIEQLAHIKELNPETITLLHQYLTVSRVKSERAFGFKTKTRVNRKLKKCTGLKDGSYYPSPNKYYNRFVLNYGDHFRFGLLLEKDSGERNIDDLRLYFLSYRDDANENRIIIGNYRLELGYGLIFGNPYAFYKGSDPIYSAKRQGGELMEYTLVDENASLYGITGKFCLKIYQVILFISTAKLDAALNPDGTVNNFYTSGYHRNTFEMKKKDQLTERLIGTRLSIKPIPYFSLGMTYYRSGFDHLGAVKERSDHLSSVNGGQLNELFSCDYNLTLGQFNLFGEAGRSKNKSFGLLSGILMNTRRFDMVLLTRNYAKNFISLHGNSFGEHCYPPQNEQGLYFGLSYNFLNNFKLALYFDYFKYPWSTYLIPMPSTGKDLWLGVEHQPLKKLLLCLQFHSAQKDCYKGENEIIAPRNQTGLRFQLEYRPWDEVKIRQRLEKKWINYLRYPQLRTCYTHHFEGILLYQDILLSLRNKIDLAARITLFDTDDYESRMYQLEHDVPGLLTNQMLYGQGNRWYIRLQWKTKFIAVALKMGSTQYHHINYIGSNEDMISGNTLNTINLQVESNW